MKEALTSKPTPILFTHYGENWIRGSERCLLDLLTHLDQTRFTPIVWCNSPLLADQVKALGITVYRSEFPLLLGWKAPYFDLKGFVSLLNRGTQLVDQHQVKIVHANSGAPNQWLNIIARLKNIPLLAHLHSRYPLRDRITLGLHQLPIAIGVSQPVIDQLRDDGIPKQRSRVIANGIDSQRLEQQPNIDLRQQLKLNNDHFLVATTGSLIHRKGVDLIISAIAKLVQQGLPIHLAIIGDGCERPMLEQQAKQLGIDQQIHFLGEQDNVFGLLKESADLFVSGAREEVFGLVLAEAGLAKLAVVAPAVGGIPSVVNNGKSGLLVEPENVESLSNAIHLLYMTPQLRHQMGQHGHALVMNQFTIQHNVEKLQALYQELLQTPSMHPHWYSHWQIREPLLQCCKQIFKLTFKHLSSRLLKFIMSTASSKQKGEAL